MRYAALCLTVCAVLATSGVWAQTISVETAMRGNTKIADPGLATAWTDNPAGLAVLASPNMKGQPGNGWRQAASVTGEVSGDHDTFDLNWGGSEVGNDYGLGAGFGHTKATRTYGVGFGKSWPKQGVAWGISWQNIARTKGPSDNTFDAGITGQLPIKPILGNTEIKYGFVVRDLTAQIGRAYSAGVAFDVPQGVHIDIDLADITNEFDRRLRLGATKDFGTRNMWKAGVGWDQDLFTFGALYDSGTTWQKGTWKFGAAWEEGANEHSNSVLIGAFGQWGL